MSDLKFDPSGPRKKHNGRAVFVVTALVLIFAVFGASLVSVQLVHGSEYEAKGRTVSTYSVSVPAARGEILDCNGDPLVINSQGNSIVFESLYFPAAQQDRNTLIFSLITLFESKGIAWIDDLPIVFADDGSIAFAQDADSDIKYLKSSDYLDLNSYATAQNCFDALVKRYGLGSYEQSDARKIASVCYNMKRSLFSGSNPYTFAELVPTSLVALIKENSDKYPGVDVVTTPYRYYADGTIAPHILGILGRIDSDEYSEQQQKTEAALAAASDDAEKAAVNGRAYSINDMIGKSGIESAYEEYLRGTTGTKQISVDADGNISESYSVAPEAGDSVVLTIDKGLQKVAQDSLKNRILEVTEEEAISAGLPCAGAVVAINVKTGEILASASYPTYDLSSYYEDYSSLMKQSGQPLWNRAFQSAYAPGSTMKPCVALGALQEGVITADTTFVCNGTYKCGDTTFICYQHNAHGVVNVRKAIKYSCNIFFYNVSQLLGIDKIDEYAKLFGLGSLTGVGISEVSGTRASIAYRESQGGIWNVGDTLQAAIGQSDNQFTPLQLACYCATVANNGTRYVPHLVKSIKSADMTQTIYEAEPEVACQTGIEQQYFDVVKGGMLDVANYGTVKKAFTGLPVQAAAKTGTSTKTLTINGSAYKGTNGFLISFAPYDDPEIAVAVVLENAGSGSLTATVAADIMNYYFTQMKSVTTGQSENQLIN